MLFCLQLYAKAEVLSRTIYTVTPFHITYETINNNKQISLYNLAIKEQDNSDIGILQNEEIKITLKDYVNATRGKRNGYYKVAYQYKNNIYYGTLRESTPHDFKEIAKTTSLFVMGQVLKVPGFTQAVAISKGIIKPNENQTRLKSVGENLYQSTPLKYMEKGSEFDVDEDDVLVLKLKIKDEQ
jgi:hypothetical protein